MNTKTVITASLKSPDGYTFPVYGGDLLIHKELSRLIDNGWKLTESLKQERGTIDKDGRFYPCSK